ncbi:MAG TPA: LptF/LptG family permease [Longimicrobiales bacterium]|nr:LptF/LptG family permease [Longimicrobiales bacterium]
MWILTRYILRAHLGPFLFALSVLTGILMINTVARRLETLAGKGLSWSVMAEVFVLSLPHTLALTLPMAVLVSTLYAFSSLAADNEVTALKASGVNLNRLLVPLVFAAALFGAGMVWWNDSFLPDTNHALKLLLVDIQRKSPTLQLKAQTINPIATGGSSRARYYLQAAEIRSATNRLRDVVIWDLSDPGRARTIYADSGEMAFNEAQTDLFLTLHDGWINQIDDDTPERFVRSFFERYRIQIRNVGNQLTRTDSSASRSDREMSLAMLRAEADESRAQLDSLRAQADIVTAGAIDRILEGPGNSPGRVSGDSPRRRLRLDRSPLRISGDSLYDDLSRRTFVELSSLNGRGRSLQRRASMYMVEYHKKHAISWAVIIFVLLGAPIAVRFPRGGVGLVIAASIGIFAVYYAGLIGGENLADETAISPWMAMWGPNIIFLGLAFWGLARIGKETASARGGGWDDLWHSIKGLLARPFRRTARAGEST